jgi:pimeloyl-ACP methyl ester carboxylesterase
MDYPKERKLIHSGVSYQFYEVNPGKDGVALVFLHGIGVDKGWGLRRIDRITSDCRKIFPDLPGHNGVSLDNMYDMSDVAEYFHGLADSLHLKEYVVAGYSLGGLVALKYRELFCNDTGLRGVVSWASPILGFSGIRKEGRLLISLVNSVPDRVYNMKSKASFLRKLSGRYGVKFHEDEIDALSVFSRESARKWIEIIDTATYNLDTGVPAKIIFGTNDKAVADKNYLHAKNRCGRNVEVISIENGGHFGSEEGVEEAFNEISAFVERVGNSEG